MKKVYNGRTDQNKLSSFIDVQQKKKNWVPGSPTYKNHVEFGEDQALYRQKFKKKPRYLIADDIINASKKKETSVPGPSEYKSNQWLN